MFKSYFKIAVRNLARHKVYAFINIAGLSIGLACAMLIMLYVKDEVSFDRFHKQTAHIYRIVYGFDRKGVESMGSNTGYFQGPRFTANVPGIKAFVRIQGSNEDIKHGADVENYQTLNVDSSFFSIFSFPMLSGDPKTCLKEPNSVVLAKEAAIKFFGTTDAVGKTLQVRNDSGFVAYKVTAVTANCPQNSSIQYKILLPFSESATEAKNDENWFSFFLNTFVLLEDQAKPASISVGMTKFYQRNAGEAFNALKAKYGDNGGSMGGYQLQSITDMHTSTKLPAENGLEHASNPMYSYILSGIALFVLLIACINFVNLTVARSVKRAKEIGIRKVVGSDRKQLIVQFLGESLVLCTIAFVLAIVLAGAILPVFNELSDKALSMSYLFDAKLVVGYIFLFLITSLMAGFYPALVLSGYKPVETLYSRFTLKGKNYLQKSLVVLQFTLASLLIVATLTIYAQFTYLTKADLGYDDSNVVVVQKRGMTPTDIASVRSALLKDPDILMVAGKNNGSWFTGARLANDSNISFAYQIVTESYIPMLRIPVIQGRNFSAEFPSDSSQSILVNESFVKKAGWKHPIGETVNFFYNNNKIYHVVGVVKDYHYASLSQKIGPEMFTIKSGDSYGSLYIKIKPNTAAASLRHIRNTFKTWFPISPYSYVFKNDENVKNYESEAKWKQIILFGAILTVFISCIGMFGLSVLAAEKRTKEIGIRKILGASVNSIVFILSRDFVKLVLISLLIAFPLAWLALRKWLENYPYRISLDATIFAWAAVAVVLVALLTVSFQAIKAAIATPVKSLRTE